MKKLAIVFITLFLPIVAFCGQCMGTTKKGVRCRRWVKNGNYCQDHFYGQYNPTISVRPNIVVNNKTTTKTTTRQPVVKRDEPTYTNTVYRSNTTSTYTTAAATTITNTVSEFSTSGNFAYGIPDSLGGKIVNREGYAVCFSEQLNLPLWTLYELTKAEVNSGFVSRPSNFIRDPDFPSADPALYTNSGYDKGHLVPARDVKFSFTTMTESFYMGNVVPQNHEMNAKIWVRIEDAVRDAAAKYGTVYVGTGPIFCKDNRKTLASGIPVPDMMFKTIYIPALQKQISFVVPNSVFYSKADIRDFVVTESVLGSLIAKDANSAFHMFPNAPMGGTKVASLY